MTLGAESLFPDYQLVVEKKLKAFQTAIEGAIDVVLQKWDDSILTSGAKWLVPGLAAAAEYAANKLEDAIREIWDAFTKACEEIWKKVDEMKGSPFELMKMNDKYIGAAGEMRGLKTEIDRATRQVRKGWFGEAFLAYEGRAKEQMSAAEGADTTLTKAATACADGANQIGQSWADVVEAILDYANKVVDAIEKATDAGRWVTLDAGPAIKVIADLAIEVAKLALKLSRYWMENATVAVALWRDINQGAIGLGTTTGRNPPRSTWATSGRRATGTRRTRRCRPSSRELELRPSPCCGSGGGGARPAQRRRVRRLRPAPTAPAAASGCRLPRPRR